MPIHINSLRSYDELDLSRRQREVLAVFHGKHRPITDREALGLLGMGINADMNRVRPRITELVRKGVLREVDSVEDTYTGRMVRRCEVAT